jgi:hypothetical protein
MAPFLLIAVIVVTAALTMAMVRGGWKSSTRHVNRRHRLNGADPYAAQRRPEKLNPGLGGGCASGGGG